MGMRSAPDGTPSEIYEIHRDDLLEVLFALLEGALEVSFGKSIEH
jgi:hypothetical protein